MSDHLQQKPVYCAKRSGHHRYADRETGRNRSIRHSSFVLLFLLSWVLAVPARAHSASTAYLELTLGSNTVAGRLELPLRDVDERLGLDTNDDGQLTWGELRRRSTDIATWVRQGLHLGSEIAPWGLDLADFQVSTHQGEGYVVVTFNARPTAAPALGELTYSLLLDQDPLHRCLVTFASPSPQTSHPGPQGTTVLSPQKNVLPLSFDREPGPVAFGEFVGEGMHHIWTGYDHLLFLLALLLPAVLYRTPTGWAPATSFRQAWVDVVKIVTAFTVAHSVTLGLAAFGWIRLPSQFVEATIAASIIIAALANLRSKGPLRTTPDGIGRRHWVTPWKVAFLFGLIHGFGFASVLGEMGLQRAQLTLPLLGFNAGVELGQLACVALFLPLAFWLRSTRFYRLGALPFGSALIILVAGLWLVERTLGLGFMPL